MTLIITVWATLMNRLGLKCVVDFGWIPSVKTHSQKLHKMKTQGCEKLEQCMKIEECLGGYEKDRNERFTGVVLRSWIKT